VLILTGCVVWLAATGDKLLPSVWVDPHHGGLLVLWILALVMLINATALSALWILRRSVIDEWLMVVVLASIVELAITALLGGTIFTLGFYSGRIFSLVTSTVILAALLVETTKLYARLARSNSMLQAERLNKLMNLRAAVASIRHEIRNPLQAVTANCQAALRCLKSGPPDLEEAQLALGDAIGDSFRIAEVFRNIGDLFDKDEPVQHPTDANETIFGALRLVHGRLNDRGVIARVELASDLPLVSGHKGQLQEVIINLLLNAVEAMEANREDGRQLTVRTKRHDGESISIEVQDTGLGIDPEDYNRIFEAFVTTKPGGTGLGLAICRTIVERHRGQLSVSPVIPRGTVFRILLPKADTHHR